MSRPEPRKEVVDFGDGAANTPRGIVGVQRKRLNEIQKFCNPDDHEIGRLTELTARVLKAMEVHRRFYRKKKRKKRSGK